MCKQRRIDIRVTKREYEMILNRKENLGYLSLSQFVRDLLLKEDLATYKMIRDMHNKLMGCEDDNKTGV